jgi:hypothetical protein
MFVVRYAFVVIGMSRHTFSDSFDYSIRPIDKENGTCPTLASSNMVVMRTFVVEITILLFILKT